MQLIIPLKKICKSTIGVSIKALALAFMFCWVPSVAGVRPQRIELNKDSIKAVGFDYKIRRKGNQSTIEIKFSAMIDKKYVPHSTTVDIKSRHGEFVSSSSNLVDGSNYREFDGHFNNELADLSIKLVVCEAGRPRCSGEREYVIESVSEFIQKYAVESDGGVMQGQW